GSCVSLSKIAICLTFRDGAAALCKRERRRTFRRRRIWHLVSCAPCGARPPRTAADQVRAGRAGDAVVFALEPAYDRVAEHVSVAGDTNALTAQFENDRRAHALRYPGQTSRARCDRSRRGTYPSHPINHFTHEF